MSTTILQTQQLSSYQVFCGDSPAKGPRTLPLNLDFTSVTSFSINLKLSHDKDVIEYIQGIFIDNSSNTASFSIQSRISNQNIIIPPGSQAIIPLLTPNAPDFVASSTGGIIVPIQLLTFPVMPCVWDTASEASPSSNVSIINESGVDGSGSISAGGSAQTLFGGTTPTNGYEIVNVDVSHDLWVSDSTTAAPNTAGSVRVVANGGGYDTPFLYKPVGPVSIYGGVTGQQFTAKRF